MRHLFCSIALLACLCLHATTYYVANTASCASDSNTGLSINCSGFDGPFFTLEHAVSILADNDSLIIGQGMYYDHPIIDGIQNVTILAFGDGMVTISGAMEEYTISNNNLWTLEGTRYSAYHNADFKVYYSTYPSAYTPNPAWNNTLVQNTAVDETGRKLYSYGDSTLFTLRHETAADGEGIYFDFDKMYISFQDQNKDPNTVGLFISAFWEIFYVINSASLTIDGGPNKLITLDHSGRYAIHSRSGSSMNLRNLQFLNGHISVYESPTAGSTIIDACDFHGGHDSLWTWTGVKDCFGNPGGDQAQSGCYILPDGSTNPNAISGLVTHESYAILLAGDSAHHEVRNCKIEGYFNGLVPTGGKGIIEDNEIWNIFDDAIEPEGDLEIIIRRNKVWDSFVCHAGVTTQVGPAYVYENIYCANKNIIYSFDFVNNTPHTIWEARPLKYYSNITGTPATNTHFYYNTIYGVIKPLQIGTGGCNPLNKATNSSVFNNLFISESHICSNSGQQSDGIEIRSNLFYSTNPQNPAFSCWNGPNAYPTLASAPIPASWTSNLESDPLISGGNINNPEQYFALNVLSPSRTINGFNLEPIPATWPNAANLNANRSNAGALEFGSGLTVNEPESPASSFVLFPNPSSDEVSVHFKSCNACQLSLHDTHGKVVFSKPVEGSINLNLSNLSKGVYWIQIASDSAKSTKRLIVL